MRLDAEKLDVLRRWGAGLSRDERDEVRSAGRAILLLIEEIEQLHIDMWHAREAPEPTDDADDSFVASLRRRLRPETGEREPRPR